MLVVFLSLLLTFSCPRPFHLWCSFEPTCITAGSGYLAAGGQSSQLDVREAAPGSGTIVFKGYSGGSVNNALRITRDASHTLRLFLCNNDDTVKVFSLESGAMECVVRCPVAINHCALSPDGQRMVCVGDNRHTYLYQATPTGYRPLHVFTEAADAGMSCDWSPSGSIFAAASQDGLTCVWDHRTEEVISKFVTPLACRNVRFAPAPLDLLAFTEHRGRCHLADARVWPRQQVLHVGGLPELEPDISGLAFSPCGSMLYVGLEEGIVSYEVNSIGRRSFASAELA